ncbi:MAG: Ig-like domain-containing protein [Thermoplasmatota archaeon]
MIQVYDMGGSGFPAVSSNSPAAVEKVGNWTVTGMETYRDSEILLNGNLSISGSLILDSSDLYVNSSAGVFPRIHLSSGGSLVVRNGSTISGKDSKRYTFQALSGSSVKISDSQIFNCGIPEPTLQDKGLYTETSNFQVLHSEISSGANGIVANGSRVSITGSNITLMDETAIHLQNGSYLNATVLNLSLCGQAGIDLRYSSMDLRLGMFTEVRSSIISLGSRFNVSGSILSSQSDVIMGLNSSTCRVVDTTPAMTGLGSIMVKLPETTPSFARFLNSTFTNFQVFDRDAKVMEAVRYDIKVTTNDGLPAEDADVEIRNRMGNLVFQGLTDGGGYIKDIELDNHLHNYSGIYPYNPHNLSVFYDGATRQMDFDGTASHAVIIRVLLGDPVVQVLYPEDGDWLPTSSFYLNGKVIDPRPITDIWLSLDGSPEVKVPGGNPFSIPLDLPDGHHDVRIVAKNDDGKYGYSEISFGIDTVYPDLNIQTPVDGAFTNGTSIKVAGTISQDAALFIQGVEVPGELYQGGTFIYTVVLEEGSNKIQVRAVDRAGNTAQRTFTVFRDSTPPTLLLFSPLNGSRINVKETLFKGTVDMSTVRLTLNGVDVPFSQGEFEYLYSGLKEGSNKLILVAHDRTGSRTVRTITVFVDTQAPEIMITDSPHLTNQVEVLIRGMTDPGTTVMVDNTIVEVIGGVFNTTVQLMEGDNNISILATDELGNSRTLYHHIILDMEPPTFESIQPASGSKVTNPILEISGTVYDDNGIRSVRGKIGSSGFVEVSRMEEWTWVVTLSLGSNIVDIEVEDKAGNIRLGQFVYTLEKKDSEMDTDPPTVVIQSPPSNTSIQSGKVLIEGWAVDDTELVSVQVKVNDGDWMEVTGLNTWSIELELEKGIYVIYAKAVDSSGNTQIESIWISVFTGSEEQDDDTGGSSKTPLVIGLAVFVIAVALFFGYLLYLRNRNLRDQLEERRRESARKEEGRRGRPGRRVPRRPRPDHDQDRNDEEGPERPRVAPPRPGKGDRSEEPVRKRGRSRRPPGGRGADD